MIKLGETAQAAAKRLSVFVAVAGLALSITACSSPAPSADASVAQPEQAQEIELAPVDLTGEWKQSNSKDPERWSEATVTADAITVNWVADSGDTKALFWAGTVETPADNAQEFSWESENDTAQTENSLLASSDSTKTFTYADGVLSYDASVMGVTSTIRLERQ